MCSSSAGALPGPYADALLGNIRDLARAHQTTLSQIDGRRLGATRDHHIRVAVLDQPRPVADRMRAGRAGRHHGMVGSLETIPDRNVPRAEIDEAAGNEER